jgi:hypothetical protein
MTTASRLWDNSIASPLPALPGHNSAYFGQESFPSSQLPVAFEISSGKGLLFHQSLPGMYNASVIANPGITRGSLDMKFARPGKYNE